MRPPGPIEAVASSVCSLMSGAARLLWRTSRSDTSRRAVIGIASAAASLMRIGMRLRTLRSFGEIRSTGSGPR